MIIFVKPQKMGVSHPICEVSLKKWGLYLSCTKCKQGKLYPISAKQPVPT